MGECQNVFREEEIIHRKLFQRVVVEEEEEEEGEEEGSNGDLREPEGEGGSSVGPPLDLAASVRAVLGTHVDVAAVQVGVSAGAEPPATCRNQDTLLVNSPLKGSGFQPVGHHDP